MERAYSLLEIKSVAAERRVFSGIASTPELDRMGDMIDLAGATFRNPIPLLFHHDTRLPIGTVTLTATPTAIMFEARLPEIADPGALKTRVDEAWHSIKAGVITGVSIGFRVLKDGMDLLSSGARRMTKTEICELSLVTIPANANATILTVKSLAIPPRKETPAMKPTTSEHIQNLENKRAALAASMSEIMTAAADAGETLGDSEKAAEHDGLAVQVKSIDADLARWREHEKLQITSATPVAALPALRTATAHPVISVRPNVPLGTAFVRMACAKLVCNGNLFEAAQYAKRWDDSTPEVQLYLKAAIAAGNTTDATWASPLVNQQMVNDFIELLRPATIMGKITNWRDVPFNCKVPSQTAGGTYNWVGEVKPKPVTKLAFSAETLAIAKAAGIIVLTDELVKLSNPRAEDLVRRDMVAGIAQFLDSQLIDPAVAAVAGQNPASITNGAPTAAGTVSPLADIGKILGALSAANIPLGGVALIMSETNALAVSFRRTTDGSRMFPDMTPSGGTMEGIQVIASNAAGANVIGVQPSMVLMADDGGVTIDASREATLQMDSAPDSPVTATTVYVSLWQMNCVGLRAERFINWKRINTNAVYYLTATAWPMPSEAAAAEPPAGTARRS